MDDELDLDMFQGAQGARVKVDKRAWMDTKRFVLGTEENLAQIVDECIASGRFALDVETSGLDTRVFQGKTRDSIAGICLSPDGEVGYYLPIRHADEFKSHNISRTAFDKEFLRLIAAVDGGVTIAVFHNAKFDQEFLTYNGGTPYGEWDNALTWDDTMIMGALRNSRSRVLGLKEMSGAAPDAGPETATGGPGLGMEMIELHELFGDDTKKKNARYDFTTLDPAEEANLWYACSDAICTLLLYNLLAEAEGLLKSDSWGFNQNFTYKIEKGCLIATRWMERNRIYIHQPTVLELIKFGQAEWIDAIDTVYAEAEKVLGRPVKPGHYKYLSEHFVADPKCSCGKAPDCGHCGGQGYDTNNLIDLQMTTAEIEAEKNPRKYGNPRGVHKDGALEWPMIYDINAPKQLGQMFEEMKVPGLKRTEKSGQIKTSKDEIERVIEEAGKDFPFMGKIRRFREVSKALSSNLYAMLRDVDPNDHTIKIGFRANKADTGRFSTPAREAARANISGIPSINFQAIPHYDPSGKSRPVCMGRLRECIRARRPGRKIVACVAEGTLVPTDKGLVPIETISAGDRVLTDLGFKSVAWAGQTGHRDVLRLKTAKGFDLRLTEDHLVRTVTSTGFTWKPAGALKSGDWIVQVVGASGRAGGERLPATPKISPWETPITTPSAMSLTLAEYLGRFMGDGCIGHRNNGKGQQIPAFVGFALGGDVQDVLPVLNHTTRDLFDCTFSEKPKGDVICSSQPFARWLDDVTQKGSTDVAEYQVPPVILAGSDAEQAAFLRGLFDADGSVGTRSGDGLALYITSEKMSRQVQILMLGQGIPSRREFVIRETNFGHSEGYLITVTGVRPLESFTRNIGCASPRKTRQLEDLIKKGRSRDASNFIPLDLARLAVRRQRNPITNRCLNNGHRHGRVSYEMLARCENYPEDIDQSWIDTLVKGVTVFDTVESVSHDGDADVYDIQVPEGNRFQANGILVHNCDYSGEELRLITNLSLEPKWLKEFFHCAECDRMFPQGDGKSTPEPPPKFCPNCGSDKIGDLHTLTALEVYGADARHKPDWKSLRGSAKGLNFAMSYGGGPSAARRAIGCTKQEGARIKGLFDSTYTTLQRWWKYQHGFAKERGYVMTPFKRKYPAPDINNPDGFFRSKAERNSVNGPIQGAGADICKIAMALIYKEMKKRGWLDKVQMIATMHDELVFEIDDDILEEAFFVLMPIMCRNPAVLAQKWPVPLTCDVEFGDDWSVPYDLEKCRHKQNKDKDGNKIGFPPEIAHLFPKGGWPSEDEDRITDLFQGKPPGGEAPPTPPPPPAAPPVPDAPEAASAEALWESRAVVAPEPAPPPLAKGDYFDFRLHAPLTLDTAIKLAEVIQMTQNKGTQILRLFSARGESLDAWLAYGNNGEPLKVNHVWFTVFASQRGLCIA